MSAPTARSSFLPRGGSPADWILLLALLSLAIPTTLRLADQTWSKEFGAHGPIVLFTGAWLLWRAIPRMQALASPSRPWLTGLGVVVSLLLYVVGRAYDFISLEGAGLYVFCVSLLYDRLGAKSLLDAWFPILYLGLLVPAPGWLMDRVTAPLKLFVSHLATSIVEPLGLPIVREGVTLTVGPYQLLVEDACSGMNSLVGLVAITLFYIHLLEKAGWRYHLFLFLLIIPVAIIANTIRIVILILLTYFFGDAIGQSFLHVSAGLLLFALSLGLMFAIDKVAWSALQRFRKPA